MSFEKYRYDGSRPFKIAQCSTDETSLCADRGDADSDSVSLMTSHCSKGLEFPTVYVAGCEEGLYPSIRNDDSEAELEEERRLFYVSVTRAKDRLVLTSCEERWRYGDTSDCETSRFIGEMCPDAE